MKLMPSSATVTARRCALCPAQMAAAMSICASTQPPEISPAGLVSLGMASTRVVRCPVVVSVMAMEFLEC
jgi:hypothetical protein